MKTLVTGATGFLGAALTRRLIQENVRVRAIRRSSSKTDLLGEFADAVEWIQADVVDPTSLENAFDGVSNVFHCAAYLGFGGRSDIERLKNVNVTGTCNVVNAAIAAGVERLVHTSSISVLGRHPNNTECLSESSEWRPSKISSGYGESKYRAELEIQRGIAEGLDAVIVNPSVIMGPGRSGENTMILVEKIRKGRIPFVPQGATNVVDVLDVVEGHFRAMDVGTTGERYILAGENLAWKEIFSQLADALGVRTPTRSLPLSVSIPLAGLYEMSARLIGRRPVVTRETVRLASVAACFDNTKAIEELGCSFRPFSDTAQRLAASLRDGV